MPTLDWIGKDKVINHHMDVPYRVLDKQYTYGRDKSENMIIHGDNLEALKSLLPKYEGKVKCIYIDPPYNTGNEGWVYNDNVNDPKIKKWLGEVVGKEGEDLSRHDKWLCMMYPRLKLLQKLLSEDGAIFISIDDNELYNLKIICDEIFGSNCFVSNVSWQRTYSTRNDSKGIVNEIEHVLVYSKNPDWQPQKLARTAEMDAKYKNPDNDVTPWRTDNAFAPGAATHQGMVYAIQHPFTGEMLYPSNGRCWPFQQQQMLEIMRGWCAYELKDIDDAEKRADVCGVPQEKVRNDVCAIVLSCSLEESKRSAERVYKRGQWPRFFFTKNGLGGIARKTYLDSVGGKPPTNLWLHSDTGHTDEAAKIIKGIFAGRATFDTPKPPRLIERILHIVGVEDDMIVLDAFAGSGTTAHAVLNKNKEDGGHRRFILIEMGDYADTITAERVKRVIDGYGEGKSAVEGTGGDFTYYELGQPLFIEDHQLNPEVPDEKICEYIWYAETHTSYEPKDAPYYLGVANGTAYYFYYEKEALCILNYAFLSHVQEKADHYVIYADQCTLSDDELLKYGITFKKIPRDIARL